MRNFKLTFIVFAFIVSPAFVFAKNAKGSEMSQQHRSQVAEVVNQLTELAGKDKNIGEEVKQVAQEQQESEDHIVGLMDTVESRGKFKIFFLGSDYKNLGALRSELVTSANHIKRLQRAMASTTDETVVTELQKQIDTLEQAKSDAEDFVKNHESQFSLFGWLVKLFN